MANSKAALILAFGKPKMGKPMGKGPMMDKDMEGGEEEESDTVGKEAIAQSVIDAVKSGSAKELASALDDFVSSC